MAEVLDSEVVEFNYFKKWLSISKESQIHMFSINDHNETIFENTIECGCRVLKIAWSDNQCLDLMAVLTEDMMVTLFLRNYYKQPNQYIWETIHKFPPLDEKCIISDLKFAPSKYGMYLVILYENGQFFVYQCLPTLFLRKDAPWLTVYESSVNRFSVCIGWSSVKFDDNNNLLLLAIAAYGKQNDSTPLLLSENDEDDNDKEQINSQVDRELIFFQLNPIAKLWSRSFSWELPKNDQIVNNLLFIERYDNCDCILLTTDGFQVLSINYGQNDKFHVEEVDSVETSTNGIESAFWNYISETLECSCGDEKIHHFTKNAYDYWQEVLIHNKLTLSTVVKYLATNMED